MESFEFVLWWQIVSKVQIAETTYTQNKTYKSEDVQNYQNRELKIIHHFLQVGIYVCMCVVFPALYLHITPYHHNDKQNWKFTSWIHIFEDMLSHSENWHWFNFIVSDARINWFQFRGQTNFVQPFITSPISFARSKFSNILFSL